MRFKLIIVFFAFFTLKARGQTVFYQDVCNCGVTAAGFSAGINTLGTTGIITVNISPISTIKKSFLVFNKNREKLTVPISIVFNSIPYECDLTNNISNYLAIDGGISITGNCEVHLIDVTQSISPSQNSYNISIPKQLFDSFFGCFYLVVIYEDASLPKTAFSLVLNKKNATQMVNYLIDSLNPIDNTNPVGFAIQSDILWDTITDGSYVKVNGNNLGLIGGIDNSNLGFTGAGVKGHFYYQNNSLFGLDDDTPDAFMNGTDGLADISSYVSQYSTSLNCEFDRQLVTTPYNVYISLLITYTTPCDTFSVNLVTADTTICKGASVQLGVSTGSTTSSYEWLPTTGLSCSTCANPIASPDSTTYYTVRVWNTDSCSKVLPVRVKVLPQPKFSSIVTTPTICGSSTGSLTGADSLFSNGVYVGKAPQTLTNLGAGNYTLYLVDTNSCRSKDTLLTITSVNLTNALFTLNPATGAVPLSVSSDNQSTHATDYMWYFQNDSSNSVSPNFELDTSGTYTITLVAYNNTPNCSDTFSLQIVVYDSLQLIIPNVFTPNGDNQNDVFSIQVNAPCTGTIVITNRWGNEVLSKNFTADGKQKLLIWNGLADGQKVSDGVYFYSLSLRDQKGKAYRFQGFIELVR